jgi:hypothetical protein
MNPGTQHRLPVHDHRSGAAPTITEFTLSAAVAWPGGRALDPGAVLG